MPVTLAELLAPLDRLMRAEGIAYLLIGGYAVSAWGEVRATDRKARS